VAQGQIRTGGAPTAAEDLVSADQEGVIGSGISTDPLKAGYRFLGAVPGTTLSPITVVPGAALQSHIGVGGEALTDRTVGLASHAAQVAGVALDANADPHHVSPVKVQFAGIVTLTTAQWDAIAGTSGGLQRGSVYYVDQSTAGALTSTTPTGGQTSTQVGLALNSTDLLLTLAPPKTF